MKARRAVSLCLLVLLAATVPLLARGKKKVAVLEFDTSAVQSSVQKVLGQEANAGHELTRQIGAYLDIDGIYKLVDHNKIEKTLSHKKFGNLDYTLLWQALFELPRICQNRFHSQMVYWP